MSRENAGVLLVVISAVSFGFMPILAILAYSQGVGVDELLFVRFLLAFFITGAILTTSRRLILPKRKDLLALILLGALGYFLQSTLYFTSLLYSPVPIVSLLLYTYPVFVTVGAFALGWERVSRRLIGTVIIALVGLLLVANPFGNRIEFGVILALGASITYTIYILSGSKVLRRVSGDVAAFYMMGAASVSFGLTGWLTNSIRLKWSLGGWFWVLAIALVGTVIAVTVFFIGLSRIGPSRAALISLMEPVTSVLIASILFGNTLTASQWFGGLLILASTVTTTLYRNPEPRRNSSAFA